MFAVAVASYNYKIGIVAATSTISVLKGDFVIIHKIYIIIIIIIIVVVDIMIEICSINIVKVVDDGFAGAVGGRENRHFGKQDNIRTRNAVCKQSVVVAVVVVNYIFVIVVTQRGVIVYCNVAIVVVKQNVVIIDVVKSACGVIIVVVTIIIVVVGAFVVSIGQISNINNS